MLVWKAGRLAVEVWSFPTLLAPPPHPEAPPAPSALRIPSPLTSGWAAACLTRASVRCPGTPCYYCDLHKRPPTHTPSPHYSQQSDPSNHPLPPSLLLLLSTASLHLLCGSSTQAAAVFVCIAHLLFFSCYPHSEAQLGKCGAFKKDLPTY